MASQRSRTPSFWIASIALSSTLWGCSSDDHSPVGPNPSPELSTTTAAVYKIRDLGTLGGPFSQANGINNAGVVVGSSTLGAYPDTRRHAFMWKSGVMKDLGTIVGGNESSANDINSDGVMVGFSNNRAGDMRAVRWMPDGRKLSLGTLGGRNSEATAINDFGVIVGWSEIAGGQRHAFRYENGVMNDLGTMGGGWSEANDINRGGAIVGYSQVASGERHAFKWRAGAFKDIGTNSGARNSQFSIANAINTKGQIAGILGPPLDAEGEEEDFIQGFLFYQDVMTICCRVRRLTTHVEDINPNGIIVGWEEDLRGAEESDNEDPWINEAGITSRLPELSDGHSGAEAINLRGDIVGYSQPSASTFHAVLWKRQ
jgi:probable HAF family extracellular repeat protein